MQGLPGETVRLAWAYDAGATLGFANVSFAASSPDNTGRSSRACTISAAGALSC
jgi:hypothetical protein